MADENMLETLKITYELAKCRAFSNGYTQGPMIKDGKKLYELIQRAREVVEKLENSTDVFSSEGIKYRLFLDSKPLYFKSAYVTVAEIKNAGGIPSNYVLYLKNENPKDDDLLDNNAEIEIIKNEKIWLYSSIEQYSQSK